MAAGCTDPPGETVVLRVTARAGRTTAPAATGAEQAAVTVPPSAKPTNTPTPSSASSAGSLAATEQPTETMPPRATPTSAPTPTATPSPTPTPTPTSTPTPTPTPATLVSIDGRTARLAEVVDGDTFTIEADGTRTTVRLIGIDAPELDDSGGQAELALEAADALGRLLKPGPVELVADIEPQEPDSGRLLRHALSGETNIAVELAMAGWARALTLAPNLAYREEIAAAVAAARAERRGIWSPSSIEMEVDKEAEIVTIRNAGADRVDLSGWWLVSLRGAQAFRFPSGATLTPGGQLTVVSGEVTGDLAFDRRNVWNNSRQDPAELRRPDGRVAAFWDDADSG